MIEFSEFARVDIPDIWLGDRNPVKYRRLEDLDIDFSKLKWEPMPEPNSAPVPVVETPSAAKETLHKSQPCTLLG